MKWVLIILGALVALLALSVALVSLLTVLGEEMPEDQASASNIQYFQGALA